MSSQIGASSKISKPFITLILCFLMNTNIAFLIIKFAICEFFCTLAIEIKGDTLRVVSTKCHINIIAKSDFETFRSTKILFQREILVLKLFKTYCINILHFKVQGV